MGQRRARRLSPAARVAPIWNEEIAGHREISISHWRSFRCAEPSADSRPVAIDRFATLSSGFVRIRRLNGGRLTGLKAILKTTPERISCSDRDGTRHNSVAYLLSLEIGAANLRAIVANMTEPVRL